MTFSNVHNDMLELDMNWKHELEIVVHNDLLGNSPVSLCRGGADPAAGRAVGLRPHQVWPEPPIPDARFSRTPLNGAPYLRLGPRKGWRRD